MVIANFYINTYYRRNSCRGAHSLALISDAGHNLTDGLALGMAAIAIWMAKKPATSKHTFGYHRVGILTALFNAATLMGISVWIGIEAIGRFFHPVSVDGNMMMVVASIAFVLNTGIALMLRQGAKNSLNSKAAFIHMAGDAVASIAVIVTGIIVHYTGWLYADPLISLIIAGLIVASGWGILCAAIDILIEGAPSDMDTRKVVQTIKGVEPVLDVHDLHIWKVTDGINFLSCHITLPNTCNLTQAGLVIETINKLLHDNFAIGHATIQPEINEACDMNEKDSLYCPMEAHKH